MKTSRIITLLSVVPFLSSAQDWPASSDFVYFGSSTLNQSIAGNYALLQAKTAGETFLNSPQSLFLRINNSDKLVISSNGNVGIGTSSSVGSLHVTRGTASGGTAIFEGTDRASHFNYSSDENTYIRGGKPNSNVFLNDNGGNVGIGTASPAEKLEVNGNIRFTAFNQDIHWGTTTQSKITEHYGVELHGDYFHPIQVLSTALLVGYDQSDATSRSNGDVLMSGKMGIGTTVPDAPLSFANTVGNKIDLYHTTPDGGDRYGIQVQNDELRIHSGTRGLDSGGITFGKHSTTSFTEHVRFTNEGNVGIGTTDPLSKLSVNGHIRATEVKVLADITVPDYVFEPDYDLRTLQETKAYIAENKHLPEIPSASEIEENGIDLGDMNMRLLKKIEELTLYQIELMEEMQEMKKELKALKR